VDAALASQERLSHAATHELYQRYLVDRAEEAVSKARTELMALLGQMESSVHHADSPDQRVQHTTWTTSVERSRAPTAWPI
jgi:hypothetical protein